MVDSLNTKEVGVILDELMDGTTAILEKSYAQIYTADSSGKHYHDSDITGICCVVFDRKEGKCAYLRVYDSSSLKILFSMELYYGFKDCWIPLLPNFYTAPFFEGYIGFLFPNTEEAMKITKKIVIMAPPLADYEEIKLEQLQKEEELKKKAKLEKESKSFLGKAKGFFGGNKEEHKKDPTIQQSVFKDESSLKFNEETGEVDVENLPAEYKLILKNAGITKKEMQDKDYARTIFMAIANFNEDPSSLKLKLPVQKQEQKKVEVPTPSIPSKINPQNSQRIQQANEKNKCIICFIEDKGAMFQKCGHVACCLSCAHDMQKKGICPVCKTEIIDVLKCYLS